MSEQVPNSQSIPTNKTEMAGTSSTLVVIDTQIAGWETIRDSAPTGARIILIEQGVDGVTALAQALEAQMGIDALHLFTHGASGRVQLGTRWLDMQDLSPENPLVVALKNSISAEGDILLYGCDIAKDPRGLDFVHQLARLTGADLAASAGLTGGDEQGGDWELEQQIGNIEAQVLASADYNFLLGTPPDDLYTFVGATPDVDGSYVTTDGFFRLTAFDGNGGDSGLQADAYGAFINENDMSSSDTSYIQVSVNSGGSFQITDAVIGDYHSSSLADDNHFTDIYAEGLVNGTVVVSTTKASTVGAFIQDVGLDFSAFAGTPIDTFRVWYSWSTGTAQSAFNLESITISSASTEPPASDVAPSLSATAVNPTYSENGPGAILFSSVNTDTVDDSQAFTSITLSVSNVTDGAMEILTFGGNDLALTEGSGGHLEGIGSSHVSISGTTATVVLSGMTLDSSQMNELISGIAYRNESEAPNATNRLVTIAQVVDSGTNNTTNLSLSSTISIVANNDAPTATNLTQTISYNEDSGVLALGDIVVSDLDGTDQITATFTLSNTSAGTFSTGTYGTATSSYNIGSGVWSVTGSVADVNLALAAVTFTPTQDWDSDVTISTSILDADLTGPANGTFTLDVTAVNDAPMLSYDSKVGVSTFTENGGAVTIDSTLSVNDADSSTLSVATISFSANFEPGADLLTFTNTDADKYGNIDASYDAGAGILTLTSVDASATAQQFGNALRTVTFSNSSDTPSTATRTVSIAISDGEQTSDVVARTVEVAATNDAPTTAAELGYLNTGATLANGQLLAISAAMLHEGDPDSSGTDLLYTVSTPVSSGILFKDGNKNSEVDGGEALTLGSQFTQADIDSDVIKYRHDGGTGTADSFSFDLSDGETTLPTQTFNFSISARPEVSAGSGNQSYTEDGPAIAVAPELTLIDTDSAILTAAVVVITDQVSGDQLHFISQDGITGSYSAGTGTLSLTGSASITDYQAALRSITYSSTNDNPALGAGNYDRVIEFRVTDSGGLQSIAGTSQSINIANANDAPTLDDALTPTLSALAEDSGLPINGSTAGSTIASALLTGAGDVDIGAMSGLAIIDIDTSSGKLWYSVDNGTAWTEASETTSENALLLQDTALLYWQPNVNFHGTVSDALTFRAWDRTEGTGGGRYNTSANGGGTSFSSATDTAAITINSINDAPTFNAPELALNAINEDSSSTRTISALMTQLGYADVESASGGLAFTGLSGSGAWEYSTDSGATWHAVGSMDTEHALILDVNATLRYSPDGKNGESVTATVRAWDGSSGSATSGATRSVADVSLSGGTTAFSSATANVELEVGSVNDAPMLSALGTTLTAIDEDNMTSAGYRVADMLAESVSDVDTGASEGIAIYFTHTGASDYAGRWEFSLDGGNAWADVGAVSHNSALLLGAEDYVRFVPDEKNGVTASFSFRAWDQSDSNIAGTKVNASVSGSVTAYSSATDGRGIHVTSINDAPVLDVDQTPEMTPVLEDAAVPQNGVTLGQAQGATAVSALLSSAEDADGDNLGIAITNVSSGTLYFSTDAGASWGAATKLGEGNALLLASNDLVYFRPDADRFGEIDDAITFRAWDGTTAEDGGDYVPVIVGDTSAFSAGVESASITVTSVNDAPTLSATTDTFIFTENGSGTALFSEVKASTIEPDQSFTGLTLAISGLRDMGKELLVVDGSDVLLTEGNQIVTAGNALDASVVLTGDRATLTLTNVNLDAAAVQDLLQSLDYRNDSDNPEEAQRVITVTSIADNGGSSNGGIDTTLLTISSSVNTAAVNDLPEGTVKIDGTARTGSTLTVNQNIADKDGIGTFSYVWKADGIAILEATQSSLKLGAQQLGKAITVSISYVDEGGTLETITSSATNAVQTAPAPPASSPTVDGATLNESTVIAPDGTSVDVVEIAIVPAGRNEETGEPDLANIPLVSAGQNKLLEVGLPTGTGMRVETFPSGGSGEAGGISGLIAAIRSRTDAPDAQLDQQEMTGAGSSFLQGLPNSGANLIVRTLVPTVAEGSSAPLQPIKIMGSPASTLENPVATVIDARSLPSGSRIELQDINFVAIVGEIVMSGGAGSQYVTGDGHRQTIVLGEDDDMIHGGGGDDFVGSRAGEDFLYGDAGNDKLVGGAGNDHLEGGSGNDVLQGGASDAGTWRFLLVNGELVSEFAAAQPLGADEQSLNVAGPWWAEGNTVVRETDNRVQFSFESADRLQLIATLYKAAVGEWADLMEFNHYVTGDLGEAELAQGAVDYFFAKHGVASQPIEEQVTLMIEAVWGSGSATESLVSTGVDFMATGGTWSEALLILAGSSQAARLLKGPDDELVLVKDLVTSEAGRSQVGAGDDVLLGGAGNDRLVGGGGNNLLDGGDGVDVAVYTGALGDFNFELVTADGSQQVLLTRLASGETDTLQNIELLKIGGTYYGASETLVNLDLDVSHSLEGYVVELTGLQVQSFDLAGVY